MYASGTDSVPETSGIAGTVAIPTRFVWPHGGRRVFLIGSFTRWSEHVPMSPMEGCPTVFQAICSLTTGYHQYKFFVDGEWRYDENQPFVTGNYGTVNTVLLTSEPDPNPAILCLETPGSRSNMDVDNETFYRVVTLSDGTLHEAVPRFSETDLEVSRHRISAFLSTHEAFELLPESGKIITLDVDVPVKQAFHILYEQGIPMAPLWDFCKGQVVSVLTPLDFILILRELGKCGSNLTEEELETHTLSAWKEVKLLLNQHVDGHGRGPRRLAHAGPFDSLKDLALNFLQNKVSSIPIIQHGSFPELLHLASLSGILKCICRHFRHSSSSLPILQQPICSIPLGTWVPRIGESNGRPLAMLRPNASLNSALSLLVQGCLISSAATISLGYFSLAGKFLPIQRWIMTVGLANGTFSYEIASFVLSVLCDNVTARITQVFGFAAQVSSIPIVDENDSLLDIYSRSDITALAKDRAYAQIHLDEMSIHQALQLGQDASSPFSFFNGQRCQMCLRSDPLQKVMERLVNPGVRRLIIVEAGSKRVEGIISLSDVFRFLLG